MNMSGTLAVALPDCVHRANEFVSMAPPTPVLVDGLTLLTCTVAICMTIAFCWINR